LALAQVLFKHGITSFNGYQVQPGQDWQVEWFGIMPECKVALIILSPEYFHSPICVKECLELVKQGELGGGGGIVIIPVQFGMPDTKGRFLGDDMESIKAANLLKQRIKNVLPPPDQGSFTDKWEVNCEILVNRIHVVLDEIATKKTVVR
jgi:hypothetical protein